MKRIVFCAALSSEVKSFCSSLGIRIPSRKHCVSEWELNGIGVTVCVSGVGQKNMSKLLETIRCESVDCWVSIGLAGALHESYALGDCLTGYLVCLPSGETIQTKPPSWLENNEPPKVLVCAEKIIGTVTAKRELFERTGGDLVDMESAAVARFAQQRSEPFAWIRVVSDSAFDELPGEVSGCIGEDGFPSALSAMGVIACKPVLVPKMIRMGYRSQSLGKKLAETLRDFLNQIKKF